MWWFETDPQHVSIIFIYLFIHIFRKIPQSLVKFYWNSNSDHPLLITEYWILKSGWQSQLNDICQHVAEIKTLFVMKAAGDMQSCKEWPYSYFRHQWNNKMQINILVALVETHCWVVLKRQNKCWSFFKKFLNFASSLFEPRTMVVAVNIVSTSHRWFVSIPPHLSQPGALFHQNSSIFPSLYHLHPEPLSLWGIFTPLQLELWLSSWGEVKSAASPLLSRFILFYCFKPLDWQSEFASEVKVALVIGPTPTAALLSWLCLRPTSSLFIPCCTSARHLTLSSAPPLCKILIIWCCFRQVQRVRTEPVF